ncbi:hypothetical protein ACFPRL_32170 [Pseudoclavibacter helvolus]
MWRSGSRSPRIRSANSLIFTRTSTCFTLLPCALTCALPVRVPAVICCSASMVCMSSMSTAVMTCWW